MCGAVKLMARGVSDEGSACHCGMCRRWSGGAFLAVGVESLEPVEGEASTIQSSPWAERGFCAACGSSLFYRITAEGKLQGTANVALGALEDASGITVVREWFHDKKPEGYSLAGETEKVIEAEAMAMFGDG